MAFSNTPHWEAPKFSFTVQNQAEEWELFYTRAVVFLEAVDIDPAKEDLIKKGWRQMKMMFEGVDCKAIQTSAGQQHLHLRRSTHPHTSPECHTDCD